MRYLGFAVVMIGLLMLALSFLVLNQPLEGSSENPFFSAGLLLGAMVTALGLVLTFLLSYLRRRRER